MVFASDALDTAARELEDTITNNVIEILEA